MEQIFDCGPFSQKLRIGQDLKMDAFIVCVEDAVHGVRGPYRQRAFFNEILSEFEAFMMFRAVSSQY